MNELIETHFDGIMRYCRPCERWFKDYSSVLQHLVHSNAHDYCERCDREFVNGLAKNQHLADSSSHNICHRQGCRDRFTNGADFPSFADLMDHYCEDQNHHYCRPCRIDFSSGQELDRHFETSKNHHWCTRCDRDFVSDAALLQHLQSSSLHFLCRVCKRDFRATNELVQHQKIHQPRSIRCACPLTFASFSALVIHWEAGKCTTNRQFLNRLILSFPEHYRFTVPKNLGHLSGAHDRPRVADDDDYDSYEEEWICPMDVCEASFQNVRVLNQHLASPFHDEDTFKCPNLDCNARFRCLSGLLQHVENARSCSEGINCGTGSLGRLWLFLLEKFNMLPPHENIVGRVGAFFVMSKALRV